MKRSIRTKKKVALPRRSNGPADKAAIREVNAAYRQAVLDGDWSRWASLFSKEAVMMPPNGTAVKGRARIQAWARGLPPFKALENPINEIHDGAEFAIVRGRYKMTVAPPGQGDVAEAGKYLVVFRRERESWKLHRCIYNSDLPLASSASGESIETSLINMFKALDAGDRATMRSYSPPEGIQFPVRVFDYDLSNKPIVLEGAPAMNRHLDTLFEEMKKQKVKVNSEISNLRTGARGPELGFAIFDLRQTMAVEGNSETTDFHATMLMTQDSQTGKWRIFHLHATLVPTEMEAAR